MTTSPLSLDGRRVLVTGTADAPVAIADAMSSAGARVWRMLSPFDSEAAVGAAVTAAEESLGGLDQVLHAWVPDSVLQAADLVDIADQGWQDGCEAALAGAWWLARQSIPPLMRSRGSLTFLVPTIGMSGAAGFSMLAAAAEGIRVLAKGCGRQLGTSGVTVNTIATAAHLWLATADADAVTASTSLSAPAFGRPGDAGRDIAPLVALLAAPGARFLTAGTVVADGGVWMGL